MPAETKAGLLALIDQAVAAGWSTRQAAALLGLDTDRVARWRARGPDGLDDATGGVALHGLLDWERAAIIDLRQAWGETDRSHRKLAHRGSRLGLVHVSASTVRRVLAAEGLALPGSPARDPVPRRPFPDWLEWKPQRVWAYDFTHFTAAARCAIAILDLVSRKWLTTLVSAEESSIQVEVAFLAALEAEDLLAAADAAATHALRAAISSGDRDALTDAVEGGQPPLLLAVSDNGPQMRSHTTREFMAGVAIAQHFGRPHTPTPGLDRNPVRARQGRVAAPGKDHRPGRPDRRTRGGPGPVQRRPAARRAGLRHPRGRTPRPRRRHPPGPPRRAGPSPAGPHRLPSQPEEPPTMSTTAPWPGISPPDDRISSDTPQARRQNPGGTPAAAATRSPRGRHPARPIAAYEAAFNSHRCAPISRALYVGTNSGDVQNHA